MENYETNDTKKNKTSIRKIVHYAIIYFIFLILLDIIDFSVFFIVQESMTFTILLNVLRIVGGCVLMAFSFFILNKFNHLDTIEKNDELVIENFRKSISISCLILIIIFILLFGTLQLLCQFLSTDTFTDIFIRIRPFTFIYLSLVTTLISFLHFDKTNEE